MGLRKSAFEGGLLLLNPMYSAGRTVQIVFLFGGTITIVLASFIFLLNWATRNPPAIAVTGDIVYFLAGMALILSVGMKVFNPAPAALPEGTKLVVVNRRRIIPSLKALTCVLVCIFCHFAAHTSKSFPGIRVRGAGISECLRRPKPTLAKRRRP